VLWVLLEVMSGFRQQYPTQTHLQNHDATAFTNPIDHFRTKDKNMERKASQLWKQRQSLLVA
jgi:hypothetical protein